MPTYRSRRGYARRMSYARKRKRSVRKSALSRRRLRVKRAAIRRYPGTTKTRSYAIPRLRMATQRQKTRLIKLRKDFEWTCAPAFTTSTTECLHLRFRANSILDIIPEHGQNQTALGGDQNLVWRANDVDYAAIGGNTQYPEGYHLWQGQYYHFTVIASRIVVSINQTDGTDLVPEGGGVVPTGTYQPSLAFITKFGTQANFPIGNNTTKPDLAVMPYTTMAEIHPPNDGAGQISGCKLSMGYSAKRFESIPSPLSAEQLRGSVPIQGAAVTPNMHPDEQTFFAVGVCPQRGAAASASDEMQPFQMQVKIEYSVVLTEPTPHQKFGLPPGPALATAAAAAAMSTGGDI